jgi:hypothetical protein
MNKYFITFVVFGALSLFAVAEDKPASAAGDADKDKKIGLVIVSASYGSAATHHSIDTTRILRKALRSGAATIKLNTAEGAGGVDPARTKPKETTIVYTVNGERKQKTFPESKVLNFKEDLN